MRRFVIGACLLVLCFALFGCGSPSAQQQADGTQDVQDTPEEPEQQTDYTTGTHHAEMVVEGYEDTPIEIEIYSDEAPVSASTFAQLVEEGYYDGKTLFWILDGMYVRIGNVTQDNDHLITGEFEESDISNSISLKQGVIALNRAEDGQQSDASSLIIFLSDLSYLNGKYAGFAQITDGMNVLTEIADLTKSDDEKTLIETDESGEITDEADRPVITSIRMVD